MIDTNEKKGLGVPAEDGGRSTAPAGEAPSVRLRPDAILSRADRGLAHCMIASLHGSRDLERGGNCDCHHCTKECNCA